VETIQIRMGRKVIAIQGCSGLSYERKVREWKDFFFRKLDLERKE